MKKAVKKIMAVVLAFALIVIDSAKNLFNDEWPGSLWPINPNA